MAVNESIAQPQEFFAVNIFKATEYIIPIYQRNYAWGKDEIEQLLDDINDVPDNFTGKYYLGSLIVNRIDTDVFEVIDGQQRLTTLFLLLSFLNHDSVNKSSLRFEAREKSNNTLRDIDSIKDTATELKIDHQYSSEIIEGYSVIRRYFDGKDESFIDKFTRKLSSVAIIRTQVPENIDLNHYFEMMNTRGEQLEIHEIVKAKILGAIKTGDIATEDDKKDRKIAGIIWDACSQMDRYVQMCFSADERKKLFTAENWDSFDCQSFSDVRRAFDDIIYTDETSFTLRNKLIDPMKINSIKTEKEDNERFESIVSFPNFILQVNEAMNANVEDNDASLDDKRFIDLLKNRWESKESALNFVFSLLNYRYLFDRYIIKREYIGQYKVDGKWSLQRLEAYRDKTGIKPSYKATFDNDIDSDEYEDSANSRLKLLQSCLRVTYTSPKTMHWIARVLTMANEGETVENIIFRLETYCCKKIDDAEYRTCRGFKTERIIFTYLDYILCRDDPNAFKEFNFQFRTSIEHFFPQHSINDDNTVDEEHRDSFGNLALLTVAANSKFSNMQPVHKIEQFPGIVKQSPKLMIMSQLLYDNDRKWDNDLVTHHNNQMHDLLAQDIRNHGV